MGWRESRYGFHISEYNGIWRWILRDTDGKSVAQSPGEGYPTSEEAKHAMEKTIDFIHHNGRTIPVQIHEG